MTEKVAIANETCLLDETMDEKVEATDDGMKKNYKQREDFTSEIYKIEINNMPKFGYGVRKIIALHKRNRLKL